MMAHSLAASWPFAIRELIQGMVLPSTGMGQPGLGLPGWSFSLLEPRDVLVRWGAFVPHYAFAVAEFLNLCLGMKDYTRLQFYSPFARGGAMVGGRPWRPLPGERVAEAEDLLVGQVQERGEALVTFRPEKLEPGDGLYALHAHAQDAKLFLTVNLTSLDAWRELPYLMFEWAVWHAWLSFRVGLSPGAMALSASVGYVLQPDLPRLREMLSGPAPVGSSFDALDLEPDWHLMHQLEEQLRRYGNDERLVEIDAKPILPRCWADLMAPLCLRLNPSMEQLPDYWRKVCDAGA
jgi:hypothetical protein